METEKERDVRMALYLCDLTPKDIEPQLIMRKTSDKYQLRYLIQNTQTEAINTVKVIKEKEGLRNCHS